MVQLGVASKQMQKKDKTASVNLFVTKEKAIHYLQISPEEFRKLCILKGIFPRLPNRQFAGTQTQYYFKKDITHLSRDPAMETLRKIKVYLKKHKRFQVLKQEHALKFLELAKPNYDYSRLIKERYPTPDAAIADLDDCLSMVALYACMPAEHGDLASVCKTLMRQFDAYVAATRSLRKCFISTKGYYFQAIICNQVVTWLEPHKFAVTVPVDVEMTVLKTFTEFYTHLLGAVLLNLFNQLQISYPLPDEEQGIDCLVQKSRFVTEVISQYNFKNTSLQQQVFENQVFAIGREGPRQQLELVIVAGGGRVISSSEEVENQVTHIVADRPMQPKAGQEVVQPQYVFDCFNCGIQLPTCEYAVNQPLPPHLSPFQFDFTTEKQDGDEVKYIPERLTQIVNYYQRSISQNKPEVLEVISSEANVQERLLLGQRVALADNDKELESSEEEKETNFDYDEKIKKDIEMDPKLRMQAGMLSGKKKRAYDEIVQKETRLKQKKEQLVKKRQLAKQSK